MQRVLLSSVIVPLLLAFTSACGESDASPPPASAGSAGTPGVAGAGGTAASGGNAGTSSSDAGAAGSEEGGSAGEGGAAPTPGGDFGRLGVNDVSYLFPLSSNAQELASLLRLDAAGAHGAVIARATFGSIIDHLTELHGVDESYALARVVAVRLDPCASHLASDEAACQPEVRLSAQLADDPGRFFDSGLHLAYRVPRGELNDMLGELVRAKDGADFSELPLGPHPLMVQQGLEGAFAGELKRIVLAHIGDSRLVKVTTVIAGRSLNDWFFNQYDRKGNVFEATQIPTTDGNAQGFDEFAFDPTIERDTQLNGLDPELGFPLVLANSAQAQQLGKPELVAALTRLSKLENPDEVSLATVDCVSCHLSGNAREFYQRLTKTTVEPRFAAPAGQNLERRDQTELSGRSVRAFGYFGDLVAVSQRTINESARVANWFMVGGP